MASTEQTLCVNPATGEVMGQIPLNSEADVEHAITRAREVQSDWAALPLKTRVGHLRRVRDYLADNADELAEIIARDNGKTRTD
ncbi:MAG: aldehyde dehydrogenase family protein, partial [Sulfitobacter sp.]|nr:aldehyde dehydrogenase family protein [Sulfitobacter sp.]